MTRAPGPDAVEAALTLLLRRQAARAVGAAGLPADRVVRAGRRAARRRRLLGGTAGGAAVLAAVVGVAAVVDGSVLRRAADAPAAHRAVGGADAPRAADGAFDRPAGDGGGTAGDGEPAPAPLAAGPARVDVARGDAITPADRSPVLLPLPVGARLDAVTRLPAGGWLVRYAGPDGRRWLARASAGGALTRLGQVAAARLSSDGAHLAVRAAGDGPPLRVVRVVDGREVGRLAVADPLGGSLAVDRLDGDWLVLRGPVPAGTGRAPHRLWNWRTGTLLDPGEVRAVDLSAGRLARRGDPVRADAPARAAACLTVAPVAGGAAPDRGGVCHPDLRAGDDLLQLSPDARWVAVGAGGGAVVLASADVAAGRWRPLATLPGGSRFARWLDRERFLLHRAATRQEACTVALRCAALALPPGAGDPVAVGVPGAGDL